MRIGVIRHFFERDIEADPQTLAAIDAALKLLRKLGAKLVPVTLPPHQDWDACCRVILYAVIHADGTVGEVRVLQGIDDRLDENAKKAIARWHFRPATKNGSPIELEAVVQVPFAVKKSQYGF